MDLSFNMRDTSHRSQCGANSSSQEVCRTKFTFSHWWQRGNLHASLKWKKKKVLKDVSKMLLVQQSIGFRRSIESGNGAMRLVPCESKLFRPLPSSRFRLCCVLGKEESGQKRKSRLSRTTKPSCPAPLLFLVLLYGSPSFSGHTHTHTNGPFLKHTHSHTHHWQPRRGKIPYSHNLKLIVCRSYSNLFFLRLCLLLFASFVEPFLRKRKKNRMDILQTF